MVQHSSANEPASSRPVDRGIRKMPKEGDRFRCAKCGMEIQVTADCRCERPENVRFRCCDQELQQRERN